MVEFGFYALVLSLCLSLYATVMGGLSFFRPHRGIIYSSRNALIAVNLCVTIASAILWISLLTNDFSVSYVFRNSAVDMPPLYLITSFWSSLEGSHLLWTMILSIVVTLSLLTVREKNEPLLPGLLVCYGFSLTFMTLLLVWASAPLTRLFPLQEFGQGMNALLQNPYMAAHPPSLFAGYCSLIVPFGYSVAALLRGSFTSDWLVSVRRWTLAGWAILSVGIFLGGKWAYVELGWAGYWAWDPVENSSFMPWLAATALLHTLLILDKTNRLPRLACVLAGLGFILTFLGTFITRSGVISSVHSFAESDIGPAYLIYIVVWTTLLIVLVGLRGHLLQGAAQAQTWVASKESALLFTNFFLLFLLALVCIGTLLPLIVEAVRGVKISIQQPFFNAFAPWIGVGLVALLGVGNLMRWRNGKIEDPVSGLLFPAIWATVLTGVITWHKQLDVRSAIGFWLVLWTALVMVMDLVFRLRALRWNGQLLWKFNRPYLGSWIVHLGFLIAIAGFLGGYRGIQAEAVINYNESAQFYGYTLTNRGMREEAAYNYRYVSAVIEAKNEKGEVVEVLPRRSKYTNKEEWLNEIGIHSTFWHDVYLVLANFDMNTKQVSLKMHINPTVKFVWTSLVVMVLGAMVGLSHRAKRRSLDVSPNGLVLESATEDADLLAESLAPVRLSQKVHSAMIVTGAVVLLAFGFSGTAWANEESNKARMQYSQEMLDIGNQLRCPTCQGISILESDTPQSVAMRKEIERQVSEGKKKDEIISFFRDRYGEWILRQPDTSQSFGLMVWVIPSVGLVLGPAWLIFALRSSRRREEEERLAIEKELRQFIEQAKSVGGQA
jgi:cytochrome c-type biogenesis protein CcmF